MLSFVLLAVLGVVTAPSVSGKLTWGTTQNLFIFGDSYTTTGYNVSAGINSPVPGYVSSNGPNWVEYLTTTYNVAGTKIWNLAYGGATTDSKLVTPYEPTVQSFVDQVALWDQYFAPHPAEAPWTSADSLFAVFMGINDVGNSWDWTNVTQHGFHETVLNRYFGLVDNLYSKGARSFLFFDVPPINRAPLFVSQGTKVANQVAASLADYNEQLSQRITALEHQYHDLDQVVYFQTTPIFNNLLDNGNLYGFVNTTGYCAAYENGTPAEDTQDLPCLPVANYFWLNTLHPLFFIHEHLAHAVTTILSS